MLAAMSPDQPDGFPDRETLPTFVDFDAFDGGAPRKGEARPVLIQTAGLDTGRLFSIPEGSSCLLRVGSWELAFDGDGTAIVGLSREGENVIAKCADDVRVNGEPAESRQLARGDRIEAGPLLLRFQHVGREEEQALTEFFAGSRRDGLTGLANRRALLEHVSSEIAYARRHKEPLSVLLVDLDGSSARVIRSGYDSLDPMIRLGARAVVANVKDGDVVARVGADEVAVAQRHMPLQRARELAEVIRASIERDGADQDLTASIGVASLACVADDADEVALLERARSRMERARLSGGNRVSSED